MLTVTNKIKTYRSEGYNYYFNKETGNFARWGKTLEDDPEVAPFPEIADIEISTVCSGPHGTPCTWCYKSNTKLGHNMSLDTFEKILERFHPGLTQIAFGIGDLNANPELIDILELTRHHGIIPNITVNGAQLDQHFDGTDSTFADMLANTCGAVAVSNYGKDICYSAVQKLTSLSQKHNPEATLAQVNIHQLLSENTYEKCLSLIDNMQTDERLKDLNATVFLLLKPKGKRNCLKQLRDSKKYKRLIDKALDNKVRIGFDSCGAPSFVNAIKDREEAEQLITLAESCESTRMSIYIDAEGRAWPCSFCENQYRITPVDVLAHPNILSVWDSSQFKQFRKKLLSTKQESTGCYECPVFDLRME